MSSPYVDNAEPEEHSYDYDLVVIGGGSGGLATSKEAAQLGKKVALLDFVVPTPHGTKWGLGGTCVNVGCIPKKLFHTAALVGEEIHDSIEYGWDVSIVKHDWERLVNNIQDYIGSLNFGYRTQLRSEKVNYINAYAVFLDPHTIQCTNARKEVTRITSRRFLIATGGRPTPLEIPGGEHAITSDDVFSLDTPPGKTLVVGASYVALECAGYLTGLGYDVTVMARSIFLRGFDQQIAEMIAEFMKDHKTKFIRPAVPTKIEKLDSGKLKVYWKTESSEESDEFDTVLTAIGRRPETSKIGIQAAGVKLDLIGKIPVENERTNVPHIYAIGDIISNGLELTPVAIQAGRLLAQRLYANSTTLMDYTFVPTTVFTPIEYGCCGYSEEAAIAQFGLDNIEVYHTNMKPLEWNLPHREDNACYGKIVCLRNEKEKVIGFHVLGPHAGEITQGFGVALKAGATKEHFDQTVGIHPTMAEDFTTLKITRRSGKSTLKTGC